jgi:hypothetical protein
MAFHTFVAGTKAKASEVNENFEYVLSNFKTTIQNAIVNVYNDIDGTKTHTALGTVFDSTVVDVFSDSNGYLNTLNTGQTTMCYFSTDKFYFNGTIGCLRHTSAACYTICCCAIFCSPTLTATVNADCTFACARAAPCSAGCVTINAGANIFCLNNVEYINTCITQYSCASANGNSCGRSCVIFGPYICLICRLQSSSGETNIAQSIILNKLCAGCYSWCLNGTCCGTYACASISNYMCVHAEALNHGSACGIGAATITLAVGFTPGATVLTVNAQAITGVNSVFASVVDVNKNADNVTVYVKDGVSGCTLGTGAANTIVNLCTTTNCPIVQFCAASTKLNRIKAYGYTTM